MSAPVTVTIVATRGSTPREAGVRMQVWPDRIAGSIGGGALEWEAMRIAREMLRQGDPLARRTLTLGPELGQCCGGVVELEFAAGVGREAPAAEPIWIWGAGHVGRAIAGVLAPVGAHEIVLVDIAADRLPPDLPAAVRPLVAADPVRAVGHAPRAATHLIVTHSHALDLALCDALLRHGFAECGLIGSATKWARFRARLRAMGHADARIQNIRCPIGQPALGKHPQAIAVGVAADLLGRDTRGTIRQERWG